MRIQKSSKRKGIYSKTIQDEINRYLQFLPVRDLNLFNASPNRAPRLPVSCQIKKEIRNKLKKSFA